jgi:cytochrome c oxidase accessory protein FixG
MLDDQSFTVTYQAWRGEPRTRGKKALDAPAGDCVDCGACVMACPTGIDIRDGIQLECINCGLCIDACNHVMERTKKPKWLITWDTEARQIAKKAGRHEPIRLIRPRTIIYVSALLIASAALSTALLMRATSGLSVQRDRAPLFVPLPDGSLRNGYTVKVLNKTQINTPFDLRLDGLPGALLATTESGVGPAPTVRLLSEADRVDGFRILVTARPADMKNGSLPVRFVLRNSETGEETVYDSIFMGPAGYAGGKP